MSRCPRCPGKYNCVPPDGPDHCKFHFIGEAPGHDEDRKIKPFVGKTGDEVNRGYLPVAGLSRAAVRFDNAISCYPDRPKGKLDFTRTEDLDLLKSCTEHHLYPDLDRLKPELIIPLGVGACRAIDPDIDLEIQHGIPVSTMWGTAFPMYHPSGGLHEPKKMLLIRTDWHRLRKYILGSLRIPVDKFAGSEQYQEIEHVDQLHEVLRDRNDYTLACDTETMKGGHPFCLTFSVEPGTGNLIRADRVDLLHVFQQYLDGWRGHILFHNWMFDSLVVARMNLVFPNNLLRDTMVLVFHLGNMAQGLKSLAYRELGMKMQDFSDLVKPYSTQRILEYYENARYTEWPKPEPEMVRDEKGEWKLYRPQGLSTKLKRFFTDFKKNQDKDIFKTWDNWESCQDMMERELGPYPGKCISHVPFEKVLHYACRDADSLLRLYPILQYMRKRVRKTVQEKWLDGYPA